MEIQWGTVIYQLIAFSIIAVILIFIVKMVASFLSKKTSREDMTIQLLKEILSEVKNKKINN